MKKYKELLFLRKQSGMLWDNSRSQIIFLKMLSYVWIRTVKEKTYLRRFCTQIASNLLKKKKQRIFRQCVFTVVCAGKKLHNSHKPVHALKRRWPFNRMWRNQYTYKCRNGWECFKLKVFDAYFLFMVFYFNYIFQIISHLSVRLYWRGTFSAHMCTHYCCSLSTNI